MSRRNWNLYDLPHSRGFGRRYMQWCDYLLGSSSRSKTGGSVYWHDKNLFHRNLMVVARALYDKDGRAVIFKSDKEHWYATRVKPSPVPIIGSVPCIGGVSPGHANSDDVFLENVRLHCITFADHLIDKANKLGPASIAEHFRAVEWLDAQPKEASRPQGHFNPHNKDWHVDRWGQLLDGLGTLYDSVNWRFARGWDDQPNRRLEFEAIVEDKRRTGEDPKWIEANAIKRERAKARKAAAKALLLEAGS